MLAVEYDVHTAQATPCPPQVLLKQQKLTEHVASSPPGLQDTVRGNQVQDENACGHGLQGQHQPPIVHDQKGCTVLRELYILSLGEGMQSAGDAPYCHRVRKAEGSLIPVLLKRRCGRWKPIPGIR